MNLFVTASFKQNNFSQHFTDYFEGLFPTHSLLFCLSTSLKSKSTIKYVKEEKAMKCQMKVAVQSIRFFHRLTTHQRQSCRIEWLPT
jgi:hypothetical protein